MKRLSLLACSALSISALTTVQAAAPPNVRVTALGRHVGGQVVYQYEVENLGSSSIKRIIVGQYLPVSGEGEAELSVAPLSDGNSLWLSPMVAARPEGWGVALVFPEESDKFSLEWIEANYFAQLWPASPPVENAPARVSAPQYLAPSTKVSQFTATVPRMDLGYVTGHLTVDFGGKLVNVPLSKGDARAPEITWSAHRLNQNESKGQWALLKLEATVADEVDPNPVLILDPVTSNQTLADGDVSVAKVANKAWNVKVKNVPERTYVFTARATDASGNKGSKSYIYNVIP